MRTHRRVLGRGGTGSDPSSLKAAKQGGEEGSREVRRLLPQSWWEMKELDRDGGVEAVGCQILDLLCRWSQQARTGCGRRGKQGHEDD